MTPCHLVQITTPKKCLLNGLWFGNKRPKRVVVWVHGLGGSLFSRQSIIELLTDNETAVLTFNNRGHDNIASLSRVGKRKVGRILRAGAAHEVFTDCVDDIQGAINFAKKTGVKNIYLAGHSTGCQKSVYWASENKGGKGVKGIILLGAVSDYSAEMKLQGKRRMERATSAARSLVRRGKKHSLLPENMWHETLDAQRFLSLYTPDSREEIFTYSQPKKTPRALRSVKVPILVLWAQKEEFADRPAKAILAWFGRHLKPEDRTVLILRTGHLFKGGEKAVVKEIRKFMRSA
ncbi:MAG: alpha/beta fold hydrolase [Patescibacteria group bacterium]|nr:alpha/beta fold hydrolase [bacterium]MDZ4227496.1 alpha/beta fold hydrolase [Patescibacteria group bacterium]